MNQNEHWNKQESKENTNKLLELIKTAKRISVKEMRQKLKWSPTTVNAHLHTLKDGNKPLIRKIIDENGKQVYEINPENINFTDAQLGKFNAFRFIENFMKDPDNGIAVDGKEPEWIRKAYTWIDETNPNDPLYFSVAIEHKNPKIFLMLNPHLNQKIKKGV